MNNFLNIFLSFSILITSLTPSYAGLLNSPEKIEEFADQLENYGSLTTARTFKGAADKTGAGILHYAEHEGQTLVLLGLRNDTKTWCNFGGKTDGEEYLHETAAREVSEESNGIYATHPEIIKALPYTDILNSQETYFRMYWQQVPYIPAERLLTKMHDAVGAHNTEYTEFKWVAINQLISMNDLYSHLKETLSTAAGTKFLKILAGNPKALQSFAPNITNLKNRVFLFDLEPHTGKDGKLYGTVKRSFVLKNRQWFYQDQILPALEKTEPQVLETPKVLAEKQLAKAVSAHAAAMAQIKKRSPLGIEPQEISPAINPITNPDLDPNLWNPDPRYTLTRSHLRLVLGDSYDESGTWNGDLENLKKYYNRYGGTDEFKHGTDADDKDYEVLADAMAFEAQHPWPVFFHAADDQLNQLWQSFTKTLGIADSNPMTQSLRLRGTDIYFNPRLDKTSGALEPLYTIETVNRLAPGGDYENGRASIILCINQGMTPGLKTTSTTSSSLAYFLSNHSVESQNTQDRFAESFALSGFDEPNYEPYRALFEQYMNAQHGEKSNSVMLALAVNPSVLNDLVYPSHGGGRPFEVPSTHQKDQMTSSILAALHHIQQAAMQQTPGTPIKLNILKNLYSEARILLAPEKFYDTAFVHVRGFSRFSLSDTAQSSYEKSLEQLSVETLSDWLASNNRLIEGSWYQEPRVRKLYRMVYPAVFGEPVVEKNGRKGFFYLLNNLMIDAAKAVVAQDPSLAALLQSPTQVQEMVHSLLSNDQPAVVVRLMREFNVAYAFLESNPNTIKFMEYEVLSEGSGLGLEYLLEHFYTPKNPLGAIFESKILPELSEILEDCFYDKDEDCIRYVHLLLENLAEPQREILISKILAFDPGFSEFKDFIDIAPFSDEFKRQMISDYLNAQRKIHAGTIGMFEKEFIEKYFPTKEVAMGLNPKTHTPYIFELLLNNFYDVKEMVIHWGLEAETNLFLKGAYELGQTVYSSLNSSGLFYTSNLGFDPQARQWLNAAQALGQKVDGSVGSLIAFFQHMETCIDGIKVAVPDVMPYASPVYSKVIKSGPTFTTMDLKTLVDLVVSSGDKKMLMDYLESNTFIQQLFRNIFTVLNFTTFTPNYVDLFEINRLRYLKLFKPLSDALQSPEPIPDDLLQDYLRYPANPLAWRFYMAKTLLENVKRENLKAVIEFLYPDDKTILFRESTAPFDISLVGPGVNLTYMPPVVAFENNPNLMPIDILGIFSDRDLQRAIKDESIHRGNLDVLEAFAEEARLQDYPLTMQAVIEDEIWYGKCLEHLNGENTQALIGHDFTAFNRYNNRGMIPNVLKVFGKPECFELSKVLINQDPNLILNGTINGIPILDVLHMDPKNAPLIRKLYAFAQEKIKELQNKAK